jgi:hypothetical protein
MLRQVGRWPVLASLLASLGLPFVARFGLCVETAEGSNEVIFDVRVACLAALQQWVMGGTNWKAIPSSRMYSLRTAEHSLCSGWRVG